MKKMSLKTRLVLLHTGMMVFVVCIVLALLFSISSHEILSNVEILWKKALPAPLKISHIKTAAWNSTPI